MFSGFMLCPAVLSSLVHPEFPSRQWGRVSVRGRLSAKTHERMFLLWVLWQYTNTSINWCVAVNHLVRWSLATKFRDKKTQIALSIPHVTSHVVRRFLGKATPVGSLTNERKERSSRNVVFVANRPRPLVLSLCPNCIKWDALFASVRTLCVVSSAFVHVSISWLFGVKIYRYSELISLVSIPVSLPQNL